MGASEKELAGQEGVNPFVAGVDEAEGLDKIELLQTHAEGEISEKALHILTTYFEARP